MACLSLQYGGRLGEDVPYSRLISSAHNFNAVKSPNGHVSDPFMNMPYIGGRPNGRTEQRKSTSRVAVFTKLHECVSKAKYSL